MLRESEDWAAPQTLLAAGSAATDGIIYRDADPSDLPSLRSLHYEMFPVDYEDSFFERVAYHQDGLENLTAVSRDEEGNEALIGFVTARAFKLWECDPVDRAYLELDDRLLDHETVFYILTLAVSPHFRKRGIGARLVGWVVEHARRCHCRAACLHVIDYNIVAMNLYRSQGFQEVACRENFYHITSGRQPDPKKEIYDAFLFAYLINTDIERGLVSYLFLVTAPLRSIFGHLQACLPWNTPPGSYFGGGEHAMENNQTGKHIPRIATSRNNATRQTPSWLLSLFSRQKLLRQQ